MKKVSILLPALLLILLSACKPDQFDSVGEPFDRVQQLQGTWKMAQVFQVDTEAEFRGFPEYVQRQDVTTLVAGVAYTDFEITFTVGSDGKPATFSVKKGTAPVDVPASGSWGFNDPDFPSVITLTNGSVSRKVDIASLANLSAGKLTIKEIRRYLKSDGSEGKDFLRYEYTLVKK